MTIDLNKSYFMMSFRFDKSKPEDFGLIASNDKENIFIDMKDASLWKKRELYDFGWGREYGFMRLPKLEFDELWALLENSKIQENRYGASDVIIEEYPTELMNHVLELLDIPNKIDLETKEIFGILKLDQAINRSNIMGKSYKEIQDDFEKWQKISERVTKLMSKD